MKGCILIRVIVSIVGYYNMKDKKTYKPKHINVIKMEKFLLKKQEENTKTNNNIKNNKL